jgi:hypothetical protein
MVLYSITGVVLKLHQTPTSNPAQILIVPFACSAGQTVEHELYEIFKNLQSVTLQLLVSVGVILMFKSFVHNFRPARLMKMIYLLKMDQGSYQKTAFLR